MMDKRLISSVEESKRYIAGNVVAQWVCLIANITMIAALARLFGTLFQKKANTDANCSHCADHGGSGDSALFYAAAFCKNVFSVRTGGQKEAAQYDLSKAAGVGRFLS